MAQISNPYLSQIERGLRKPSAEILQQLAKALRISAETLYVQAGILEERPDANDLTRVIWDEPSLTEAQKRALVQVYRSFQAENRATPEGDGEPAPADRSDTPADRPADRPAENGDGADVSAA